jgi:hypothetical protein
MAGGTVTWNDVLRRYYAPSWPNGQLPAAPENLAQAVLPGWNFGTIVNVSEENSAAPETELAILRTQSYGRQLGQISDALQVLITERAKAGGKTDPALQRFSEMRAEIEGIKRSGLPDRVAQLCTDLAALQKEDGTEYDRLRRQLLTALEERTGSRRVGTATA